MICIGAEASLADNVYPKLEHSTYSSADSDLYHVPSPRGAHQVVGMKNHVSAK